MVLPNKLTIALGIALAIINAVIAFLGLSGAWMAGLDGVVLMAGAFGVQMLTPAQISAKIPAHIAVIATSALAAVNGFLQAGVSLPHVVHAIIGAAFAIAAALGITVTGVAVSKSAKAVKAKSRRRA